MLFKTQNRVLASVFNLQSSEKKFFLSQPTITVGTIKQYFLDWNFLKLILMGSAWLTGGMIKSDTHLNNFRYSRSVTMN